MLPAAMLAAALVYLPIFFIRRKRNPVFLLARHAADYIFLGCCAMLSQVVFGWATVSPVPKEHFVNLDLFKTFREAYYEGNKISSIQIMLNILMFLPFGFLLPVVFPKKMNSFSRICAVVLTVTVMIEAMQYFIGRVADVSDVVTNFAGGLCGFSIYVMLYMRYKDEPSFSRICTGRLRLPVLSGPLSIGIITITLVAPIAVNTVLFALRGK